MTQDLTTISSPDLSVTLSPLGAEMQAITLADGRELLWHGDPAHWSGRAPVLFPIVGRAPDDILSSGGVEAPMKQHGFARRSTFELEEATASLARFVLTDSDESRGVYPFLFRLTLTYRVEGAQLSVLAEVENRDSHDMPFGLGFHPAFAWPLPGAEGEDHHILLRDDAEPALARLTDGYLTDDRLPSPFDKGLLTVTPDLFEADAMIFPEGSGSELLYAAQGGDAPALRFRFENTPNLGIWTKPGAPFLCIEPWHGMAARQGAGPEITERPNTVRLSPGATQRFGYEVNVE
ncbi:aldose 1-epimerase family protein [Pseudooceanicola algae]|uniref:Protein LacX, plasmid n=1 Tax=Pseudooceanicola algae TaxID=1537215 RepID=A0A418SHS8_9RHOB|nr:aldose 1-epimerase family protein [Pseudooceanicola algae]QPM90236.1 Protein LacX, plasmid [Pseudooceanicola algae]